MPRVLLALLILLGSGPVDAQQADVRDTIQRVKRSVVAVGTYQASRNPRFAFRGTGFAVGSGTLVATDAHVIPR